MLDILTKTTLKIEMLYICDLKGEWVDLIYTGARFGGWGPWPVSSYAVLVIVRQTHTVSSIFVYILVLTHLPSGQNDCRFTDDIFQIHFREWKVLCFD